MWTWWWWWWYQIRHIFIYPCVWIVCIYTTHSCVLYAVYAIYLIKQRGESNGHVGRGGGGEWNRLFYLLGGLLYGNRMCRFNQMRGAEWWEGARQDDGEEANEKFDTMRIFFFLLVVCVNCCDIFESMGEVILLSNPKCCADGPEICLNKMFIN